MPTGPPTLRRYKSTPKPLSEILRGLRKMEDEQHDDDMDALHELESGELNVRAADLRAGSQEAAASEKETQDGKQKVAKVWKKKGQKRTTRRAIMRPVRVKPQQAPRYVARETESESEDEISRVEPTQQKTSNAEPQAGENESGPPSADELSSPADMLAHNKDRDDFGSDADFDDANDGNGLADDDNDDNRSKIRKRSSRKDKASKTKSQKPGSRTRKLEDDKATAKEGGDGVNNAKPGKRNTINPNAVSHMNFRSLKIRNKNSKAKAGGRFGKRFGRGR